MAQISDEDRDEWRQHPVTQELLGHLRDAQQESKDAWADEVFTGESADECLAKNAKAIGGVNMLKQVIDKIESYELTRSE